MYFSADIHSKMDELLGNMGVEMDGRFASIRTRETNLGIETTVFIIYLSKLVFYI